MSKQDEIPEQVQVRMDKAEELKSLGGNPFRNDFKPTSTSADIKQYYHWAPTGEEDKDGNPVYRCGRNVGRQPGSERFSIAGRVMLLRSFGKAAFVQIRDRHGDFQAYVRKDTVGDEAFARFQLCDLGDIIGVSGGCFLTKTGELTLKAERFQILTKALRPLPEKWQGLKDIEKRYRQRYVDLIANPEVGDVFRKRSAIIKAMRRFLDSQDFLEVETPMMHPLIGGAAAKPFITHHNTLDMQLYMRIAPELYLKRLLVGGFERVYEINRNFRNEGISTQHNPEFTMLEFYLAYATFEDLMSLTENMISSIAEEVCGSAKVTYQDAELNFAAPWKRMTMKEAIVEVWNGEWGPAKGADAISEEVLDDPEQVEALVNKYFAPAEGDNPYDGMEYGERIGFLFEEIAEEKLIQPTFITGFPTAISPLARRSETNGEYTDRFEIYVYGRELGNAFSELNDPMDQKQRFVRQLEKKEAGADETMDYDSDYITALEHGMPPAAGEGIGIDRLVMFLCNAPSIRDVILFPQLKN
ncbi:MAG: lysine--tRNA ligase [Deltaproteobacteria bacterium]|nr:MAG: lysine--tRNA ligase [Deltaproteobacteria bacterium]